MKKAIAIILSVILIMGITVPAAAIKSITPKTTVTKVKPIKMRFTWWGGESRHKATLNAIAAYKKINPNITIQGEYSGYDGYQQKILLQLAAGCIGDLVQLDPIWNLQLGRQKSSFVDFSAEKAVDMTQFDAKIIKGFCTTNGIVIGLPMGINGFGVMMNKAFMQKFNIPLDTKWTWDNIIEIGKKVNTQDSNSYLGMMDVSQLQSVFLSDYIRGKYGKFWATDDYKVTASKEELTDAFTMMNNLFDSNALAPLGEIGLYDSKMEQYPKFINNQIGLVQQWSGMVGNYKPVIKADNFTTTNAITVKGGVDSSTTYKPSMLLGASKKAKNIPEATKFVNWLLNGKEAALILKDSRSIPGSTSARKNLVEAKVLDSDIAQMVETTLKNPSEPVPLVLNNSEIATITKDICQKVVFHKQTPAQAANDLIKNITDKLNSIKK